MNKVKGKTSFSSISKIGGFLKPFRFWIIVKMISTVISAANDIFMIYIISKLVNYSLNGNKDELMIAIYLMIISALLGIIMNFLGAYASGYIGPYMSRDMKNAISDHIDKLPISYIETRHSGDFSSRMTNSISAIENFVNNNLTELLFHVIRIVVCIAVMFYMEWKLTIFVIAMIFSTAILITLIGRPISKHSGEIQQGMAQMNSVVQETISGIYMIKSYNLVQVHYQKCKTLLNEIFHKFLMIEKELAKLSAVSVFINTFPIVIFFLLGSFLVNKELLTFGSLLAFAQFINYLVTGMGELPYLIGQYHSTSGVVSHLFEVLDVDTERVDGKNFNDLNSQATVLEFEDVSFSYDGKIKILDGINFKLPRGKTVALVGPSGSGKTTIFKLISGFYEHQKGTIRIFDEPLSEWELSSARTLISQVSQDAFLFPGSIAENISCTDGQYNMEDVQNAAKIANIHEFICSQPNGYQTLVGERGIRVSGGQRQRIAIARAIMKNAPILLLDEATSALDSESEQLVQDAINRMMEDKSVLVVAHRLSTIINADLILVMNNGRIVESGSHQELLNMDGFYKRLYFNDLSKREESSIMQEIRGGGVDGFRQQNANY